MFYIVVMNYISGGKMIVEIALGAGIGALLGGVAYPIVKDWGISKEIAGLTRRIESLEGRINNVKARATNADNEAELETALAEFVQGMSEPNAQPMEVLKRVGMSHPAIAKKLIFKGGFKI